MKRPNILIFCTDEQCADHLSCMGHPHVKTPNIDRIAAEGVLFRNCYTSSPLCMPARATMFTGQTNRVTGVVDNGVDLERNLSAMPQLLADAGYRTHAVGKLHLRGRGGREIAANEDFADAPERRIYWDWPGHWTGAHYRKFPDNYFGLQTVELVQGHVNYVYGDYVTWLEENHPGAYAGYKCSNADPHPLSIDPDIHYNAWIADRCIDFIDKHLGKPETGNLKPEGGSAIGGKPERRIEKVVESGDPQVSGLSLRPSGSQGAPFFLWCSFPDPHEPFAAVKKWSDFYDDVDIELPESALELSPGSRSETMQKMGLGTEVIDSELIKKSIRQTYGMVSHIDEHVGRVLDALEEHGLADNTVVVFIADHGDQLGEHGLFYKGVYPYDRHAHIPFLVRVPGTGVQGKVVEDVVSMLDLVPTVLDLAKVPYPEVEDKDGPRALPGEVLTPVLTGDAMPVRKNAIFELDRLSTPIGPIKMRALVTNELKLVYYPQTQEKMLFDRVNDPLELKNLAELPEYKQVGSDMLSKLMDELARTEMRAHCKSKRA